MEDRISQLPVDVLISIVTRLSVTEAVRTSTLSKTWRNIYTFIPDVSFEQISMQKFWSGVPSASGVYVHQRIVAGVNAFLRYYSSDSKLLTFCLSYFYEEYNRHFLQEWMQSFNRLGVKNLKLMVCYAHGPGPLFSWHLLSGAPSLDFVGLHGFSLRQELENQISYYPFKTIEFYRSSLYSGVVESILSCCPKLESLTLCRCFHPSKFCIRSAKLTFLRIVLAEHSMVKDIEICAINLNTFEYIDCEMRTLRLTSAPLLESLAISLYRQSTSYDKSRVVGELIKYRLPRVKTFYYRTCGSSYYWEFRIFEELNNPVLGNLRELYLILTKPEFDLLKIATIFDACPLLQKFHLVTMESSSLLNGQQVERSIGFHSELEEVEFSGFSGTENDFCFALHILKSAVSLKRMRIIRCPKYYVGGGHSKWYWEKEKESRFSEEKRGMIHQRLQGQALSERAQVIILG